MDSKGLSRFWLPAFALIFMYGWGPESGGQVRADFTTDFRKFLDHHYGMGSSTRFERAELGRFFGGSFGGKNSSDEKIVNQPVIFIHGTTLRASLFLGHHAFFREKGYTEAELYATSYSDGGVTPFLMNPMRCEDVKLVRDFISAVYKYSNELKVDIIAYSMGVAITRKAILGGNCVDTGEYLGTPITHYVDTYLAVAGIAYGLENCPSKIKQFQACNLVNGMNCASKFLRDVNSREQRYEGTHSFALYSKHDFLAGQKCCDHACSELKNANLTVVRQIFDHVTVFTHTKEIQYSLITKQTADI